MDIMQAFGSIPYEGQDVILAALISDDVPSQLRQFKASFTPNDASPLADFVAAEADFSGYGVAGLAMTPSHDSAGAPFLASDDAVFTVGDPATVTNSIGGCFVTGDSGAVEAYATFDNPVNMSTPGQVLQVLCAYRVNGGLAFQVIA